MRRTGKSVVPGDYKLEQDRFSTTDSPIPRYRPEENRSSSPVATWRTLQTLSAAGIAAR
jgi:hypothetical protein